MSDLGPARRFLGIEIEKMEDGFCISQCYDARNERRHERNGEENKEEKRVVLS